MKDEIIQVPLEDYALLFQKATILDLVEWFSEENPELGFKDLFEKAVSHYNKTVIEEYNQAEDE